MRKIYIDCGAWNGNSIMIFKKRFKNSKDFEIYAFECHPKLRNKLNFLKRRNKFNFIDKAVWINNGTVNMFLGTKNLTQSSTLISSKMRLINRKHPVKVKSIDFSSWIIKNFKEDDYIVCKLNIEGAEYEVLEKMVKDKSIKFIKELYIAWHYKKLRDFPEKRHHNLIKELNNNNIKFYNWNYKVNPFQK